MSPPTDHSRRASYAVGLAGETLPGQLARSRGAPRGTTEDTRDHGWAKGFRSKFGETPRATTLAPEPPESGERARCSRAVGRHRHGHAFAWSGRCGRHNRLLAHKLHRHRPHNHRKPPGDEE